MATLEGIRTFFQADRYAMLSGVEIQSVGDETAVCTMEVKEFHFNAGNAVQGGAIFTLADFTFAVAANSGGMLTVSLNNSISFLRSPRGKRLKAEAKPISQGNTIAVYEVTVTDDLDTLVAVMTVNGFRKGTMLSMEGKDKKESYGWKGRLDVVQGDITEMKTDAIVNAANNSLLGGGGVDGAIHRAAGPELLAECRTLNGCETGQAKITKGYGLPAKYVIHTVGPVWQGGGNREPELLEHCYQNSFHLALENGIKTLAFPSISTGVYHYPLEQAAKIAMNRLKTLLEETPENKMEKVIMVCFDSRTYECYRGELEK